MASRFRRLLFAFYGFGLADAGRKTRAKESVNRKVTWQMMKAGAKIHAP
jgi:hypothetical protein